MQKCKNSGGCPHEFSTEGTRPTDAHDKPHRASLSSVGPAALEI